MDGALAVAEIEAVEPHVVATRLPAHRQRELVDVGREVPEAVEQRGRAMRNNTLLRVTRPTWRCRCELEPRRSKVQMVGRLTATHTIDSMSDPLERA